MKQAGIIGTNRAFSLPPSVVHIQQQQFLKQQRPRFGGAIPQVVLDAGPYTRAPIAFEFEAQPVDPMQRSRGKAKRIIGIGSHGLTLECGGLPPPW